MKPITNNGMFALNESNNANAYGPVVVANDSEITNETKHVIPEIGADNNICLYIGSYINDIVLYNLVLKQVEDMR